MKKTVCHLLLCAGSLLAASGVLAHHSFSAEYDNERPITLSGKVTEMKWSNPHGWIYMDVTGDDGKVTNWALETSAANGLIRRGWRKEDLPAGRSSLRQPRRMSPLAALVSSAQLVTLPSSPVTSM